MKIETYGIRAGFVTVASGADEVKELSIVAATDRPALRRTSTGQQFYELLDHSTEAHLVKVRSTHGAPLLVDHERANRVGIVRDGAVVADNGHRATIATAKLSRRARARELAGDVVDGIVGQVSIGYTIRAHKIEGTHQGLPLVRVTDWEIDEVSLLDKFPPVDVEARVLAARGVAPLDIPLTPQEGPVPDPNLDENAIRAEAQKAERDRIAALTALGETHKKRELATRAVADGMSVDAFRAQLLNLKDESMPENPTIDEAAIRAEAQKAERDRVAAITELGSTHNVGEMAQRAIADGSTVDAFRASILDSLKSRKAPAIIADPKKDNAVQYDLVRALRGIVDPSARAAEWELSKQLGGSQRGETGLVVPWGALRAQRAGANTVDFLGAVSTDARVEDAVEALRDRSFLVRSGIRVLSGLTGVADLPVVEGAVGKIGTETAVEGGETPTEAGKKSLVPQSGRAFTPISRRLLLQSSSAIEGIVRTDLLGAIAELIDSTGLAAILANATDVDAITYALTDESSPDLAIDWHASAVALETALNAAKIPARSRAFVMSAAARGEASKLHPDSGAPVFERTSPVDGALLGIPGFMFSGVSGLGLAHYEASHVFLGLFGPGVEIDLGPADNAGVRYLRAWVEFDVEKAHDESVALLVEGSD